MLHERFTCLPRQKDAVRRMIARGSLVLEEALILRYN